MAILIFVCFVTCNDIRKVFPQLFTVWHPSVCTPNSPRSCEEGVMIKYWNGDCRGSGTPIKPIHFIHQNLWSYLLLLLSEASDNFCSSVFNQRQGFSMCVYIYSEWFVSKIHSLSSSHAEIKFSAKCQLGKTLLAKVESSGHFSDTRWCLCWYCSSSSVFWKPVPQFFSSLINLDKSKKGVLNQIISRLHQLHFKHHKILFYKWTIKFQTSEIFEIKLLYPHNYHHTQW